MKPSREWSITGTAGVVCAFFVLGLSPVAAHAQGLSKDVGLVTKLAGEATFWNEGYQRTPVQAEAFMKVRQGDHFKVANGASVQLVFFQSSRQETWKGPCGFLVGDAESVAEGDGKAKPEVTTLPAGASQGVQRIPALLRRAGLSRAGAMQVRGIPADKGAHTGVQARAALTPEDESEIAAAKETYKGLRSKAKTDDVTPELYLLGVLADYEQYEEMETVLKDARAKQPSNDILKDLAGWVTAQKAKAAKP